MNFSTSTFRVVKSMISESQASFKLKVRRCIEELSSAPQWTARKESNVTGNVTRSHCRRRLNFTLKPSTGTMVVRYCFTTITVFRNGFLFSLKDP